MNKNEFGNYIRINLKEDLTVYDRITLLLKSPTPVATVKTITLLDDLTIGLVNIDVDGITYLANEYIEYKIQDGDIFIAGEWSIRVICEDDANTLKKITDNNINFTVNS